MQLTEPHALFARLCSRPHLAAVLQQTARTKRGRPDMARFLANREVRIGVLADALATGTWWPAPLAVLRIHDPKPRIIARPTVGDRVVHAALVGLLDEVWRRRLMPEDYACRPGLGSHRAVLALQRETRRHRFVLHLDVKAYFASIDIGIMLKLLENALTDDRFLGVLRAVLQAGQTVWRNRSYRAFAGLTDTWPPRDRGLPIGTSTSQYLAAHVYLNALDHHIKRVLKVPGYVRYVDDLFLFGQGRAELRGWREAIGEWLLTERGLRLKHPGARIMSCAGHLDGLGYRITRDDHRALPRTLKRLGQKVRADLAGVGDVDVARSIAATIGVVLF